MSRILNATQPIKAIYFDDHDNSLFRVGYDGVSSIEPYSEPGVYCDMTWLQVMDGERKVICRVSANKVSIFYR